MQVVSSHIASQSQHDTLLVHTVAIHETFCVHVRSKVSCKHSLYLPLDFFDFLGVPLHDCLVLAWCLHSLPLDHKTAGGDSIVIIGHLILQPRAIHHSVSLKLMFVLCHYVCCKHSCTETVIHTCWCSNTYIPVTEAA